MRWPNDGSMSPTLPDIPMSSSAEDLASFSLLGFEPESSSGSQSSTVADQAVKVQMEMDFPVSENELHSNSWLEWFLGVKDLWLLPIFPASWQQGAVLE